MEVRQPGLAMRDRLAVEQRLSDRQLAERVGDGGEVARAVPSVAGS
jgi:hypothetical protein